ncbi:heterokaryon incompatibility protein-domain-containing protein [Hypomontagnella submonticulosa]|nr:heterokaryon incompatibility protein-domain-containing protein [Hypomontagnella submonticulosa]
MANATDEDHEDRTVPELCITTLTIWNRLNPLKPSNSHSESCPVCLFSGDFDELFNGQSHYFDFVNPLSTSLPLYKIGAEKDKCPLCMLQYQVLSALSEKEIAKLKTTGRQNGEGTSTKQKQAGLFRLRSPGWGVYDKAWIVFDGGSGLSNSGIPRLPLLHGTSSPQAVSLALRKPILLVSYSSSLWREKLDTISGIAEQLKTCTRSHTACKLNDTAISYVPSRLLCVGSSNGKHANTTDDITLKFKTDVPKGAKYAALSYCWGQEEHTCLTTQENIDIFQTKIPWEALPKTFQDAVTFTRNLGLKYLWIDALCIIQGDDDDWLREAGSMLQIYQNAYVTIAGLFAKDPSIGLFSAKGTEDLQRKIVTARKGNETSDLYAREVTPDVSGILHVPLGSIGSRQNPPPLLTRAWALQERMISPRVVYFTEDELIYECRTKVQCECLSHYTGSNSGKMVHAHCLNTAKSPAMSKFLLKTQESDDWEDLVQMYSKLNLTYDTDRLVAIGGLAQEYSKSRRGQTYLAGLWSGTLAQDLLWETRDQDAFKPRPRNWVAPSWSWASAGSPVDFTWRRNVEHLQLKVTIEEASCKYTNGNPFSRATEGRIRITGQLEQATIEIKVFADHSADGINWTYTSSLQFPSSAHRHEAFHKLRLDSIISPALLPGDEADASANTRPKWFQEQDGGLSKNAGPFTIKEDVKILKLLEGSYKSALPGSRTAMYMILRPVSGNDKGVYTRVGTVTAELLETDEGRPDEMVRRLSRQHGVEEIARRVPAKAAEGLVRALSNDSQFRTATIVLL